MQPNEILVYLRKSRSDDALLSTEQVLARHEKTLDEWCEYNLTGSVPEENRYREVVSGESIESRIEMQRLLRRIESPDIRAVLVKDCSRLGRPDLEEIGRLCKLFRYTNTLIITPERTFDLKDEYQRESFEREMMRSHDYLNYIKKTLTEGRRRSARDGFFVGATAPYGYDKVDFKEGRRSCHTLAINEQEAEVVKLVFSLYVDENLSTVKIAHKLNELKIPPRKGDVWTSYTLTDMLRNEHYIGKVRYNYRKKEIAISDGETKVSKIRNKDYSLHEGKHPAIITEEQFNAARDKVGKAHKTKFSQELTNPLAGIIFCANCKRSLRKADSRLLCRNSRYCNTSSAKFDEVLSVVVKVLKENITDFEIKIDGSDKEAQAQRENMLKNLRKREKELTKTEINQWKKYTEEKMPKEVFEILNAKTLAEKTAVESAINEIEAHAPTVERYENKKRMFSDALDALLNENVSAENKNRLLRACIERIDYSREAKGDISLDFKLRIFL